MGLHVVAAVGRNLQVQQAKLEVAKAQSQEARIKRELAWMVERRQVETDEAIAHEKAAVEDVRDGLAWRQFESCSPCGLLLGVIVAVCRFECG